MPYASGTLTSALLNDGIHVLGGATTWNGTSRYRNHYVYNLTSKTWSNAPAQIPDDNSWASRAHAYGGEKIYLSGGWPAGDYLFRVYDRASNSWSYLPDIPDQYSYGYASAIVGDHLFIIGGRDGAPRNAAAYRFNLLTESWSPCASIPLNADYGGLSAAAWGTEIYVLGGDGMGGTTTLQIYDTVTNSWSQGAQLGSHHEMAATVAVDGRIYFFGGIAYAFEATPPFRNALNIYDTTTNSWSLGPSLPAAKAWSTVEFADGGFHLLGGLETENRASAAHDVYYPAP
jgi:N-acetylneuraminic acid mutarotase